MAKTDGKSKRSCTLCANCIVDSKSYRNLKHETCRPYAAIFEELCVPLCGYSCKFCTSKLNRLVKVDLDLKLKMDILRNKRKTLYDDLSELEGVKTKKIKAICTPKRTMKRVLQKNTPTPRKPGRKPTLLKPRLLKPRLVPSTREWVCGLDAMDTSKTKIFYQCQVCNEIFEQYSELEVHNKTHITLVQPDDVPQHEGQEIRPTTSIKMEQTDDEDIQIGKTNHDLTLNDGCRIKDAERSLNIVLKTSLTVHQCRVCKEEFEQYVDLEKHCEIHWTEMDAKDTHYNKYTN